MCLMMAIASFGQGKGHLTFKGVAIDGDLNSFVQKLQNKGLALQSRDGKRAYLKGDFAGYKDCTIYVYTLIGFDLVNNITVRFPVREDWTGLMSDYNNLYDMLKTKYGKPVEEHKEFKGFSDSETIKFFRVRKGESNYNACFKTANGGIVLALDHNEMECFVSLKYLDKENSQKAKQNAMSDL